jgi:hypothetical protein
MSEERLPPIHPSLPSRAQPAITVCVLTYGNHFALARRAIGSVQAFFPREDYRLVVGANAVGPETLTWLTQLERTGAIDDLIVSPINLNKCPMMRLMLARVDTEFAWWFDDDSYVTEPGTLARWLAAARQAPPSMVMWGELAYCDYPAGFTDLADVRGFVRSAAWYRGMPPPTWHPGGKGEFDFQGKGTGDGRWLFIIGGCWLIRTSTVRALDWPDPRLIKLGDDVFLGEAIRQQGWRLVNLGTPGILTNTEPRRGLVGSNKAELLTGSG